MAVGGKLNGAVIRTVHLSECRQPEPSQPIRLTKTTLTFTGKKAGTTFVVIDGVKYIITVTEEQLQDVLLPINLWITNTGVVPTGWSDGTPPSSPIPTTPATDVPHIHSKLLTAVFTAKTVLS